MRGIMECKTPGCIHTAKYMIIENRQTSYYCLICIQNIKNRSSASDLPVEN